MSVSFAKERLIFARWQKSYDKEFGCENKRHLASWIWDDGIFM
jgi:hypothetical protein